MMNEVRGCKKGNLVPVHVHSQGLGGTFSITCCCDGCSMNPVVAILYMCEE